MRRMIAQKQAQGLKKLNENIAISDDGTRVEIGGNVIVEDLESIRVAQEDTHTPLFYIEDGKLYVYDAQANEYKSITFDA